MSWTGLIICVEPEIFTTRGLESIKSRNKADVIGNNFECTKCTNFFLRTMRINLYTTICLLKRKHPYIALAFLFLLFELQNNESQDDNNNIIKVLVSALLLKSDDPQQKPQNFPRLANPPQPVVHEEQTRVLLLAYARFSFHIQTYLSNQKQIKSARVKDQLLQIWFIFCWRTAHNWYNLFLLFWTFLRPQTKVNLFPLINICHDDHFSGTIYEDYVDSERGKWIASEYLDSLLSCQVLQITDRDSFPRYNITIS